MGIEVTKEVTRSVSKNAIVKPEDVASLIVKACGAPEGTALVPVTDGNGNLSHYTLSWSETPKARKRAKKPTSGEGDGSQAQ